MLFLVITLFFSINTSALLASWEENTVNIDMSVIPGEKAQQNGTISIKNPNPVDVEIYFKTIGDLGPIMRLNSNPLMIAAGGKEDLKYTIILDQPGIYAGKISAIYISPGEKSNTSLSPNIIVKAVDKNNPDKPVEKVVKVIPVKEEAPANQEKVQEEQPEETNLAPTGLVVGNTKTTSKANPLIGLLIIIGIVGIGYTAFVLVRKKNQM